MSVYKLLPSEAYIADLITQINQATHRIDIVALVVLEDDATQGVIDALVAAAKRGVIVSIGMDLYFSYRELGLSSSRWQYMRGKVSKLRATRRRLVKAGARVHWLSQFGITFFSRRTHTKWSIVDDTVYSFGGVNLYDFGIASNDFMFKVTDPVLADRLAEEHARLIRSDRTASAYRNHVFGDQEHLVMVDGGRIGSSVIYRHACLYAEDAESIIYVSQYCPTGKLSSLLKQKKAKIYFNPWQNAENIADRLLIRISSAMHAIKSRYHRKQYLHAKYIIFTMPGGQQIAITGSHNFLAGGGPLGTREIALETRDPHIIKQLIDFTETHIKNTRR